MTETTKPPTFTEDLSLLFPIPSRAPSVLSPIAPPGVNREAADELVRLLKENHVRFHGFFNDKGFHNHLSHHLLAAYYLGATPQLLQEAYDLHAKYQRPAYGSPSPIDQNNWMDHLGNEDYYNAYLSFFSKELLKNGLERTLQKFIFAPEANFGMKAGDKHPEMISRLLGGLVHPLIFVGYGLEFGQLGHVAEGLAQAAMHGVETSNVITQNLLDNSASTPSLISAFAQKVSLKSTPTSLTPFAILGRMLKDPRLEIKKPNSERFFKDVIKEHGHIVEEYAALWDADTSTSAEVTKRIEELAWVVALVYGVGGFKKGKPFTADFFMMHMVNASLFIPSYLVHLTPPVQRMLLRSFFSVILSFWISQGRATLDIGSFYTSTSATPPIRGPQPTPNPKTLSKSNLSPNAWYPVLQSTLVHPNEHLLKLERSLAHYATLFGTSAAGRFKDVEGELEGAGLIDGTLFIRTAWLSLERCGWVREGATDGVYWDFGGFYPEDHEPKFMDGVKGMY